MQWKALLLEWGEERAVEIQQVPASICMPLEWEQ